MIAQQNRRKRESESHPPSGSASDARRMALHEAICRCPKCKGTIDKAKLCPTCAETDAAIGAMKPNAELMRSQSRE